MSFRIVLAALCLACVATKSIAADPPREVILVPAVYYDVPGAFGSNWSSHLWVTNGLERALSLYFEVSGEVIDCGASIPCGHDRLLAPGAAEELHPDNRDFAFALPSRLLYVNADVAAQVSFSLGVRDSSRAETTWGTSIPVVRSRDVRRGATWFAPIPLTSGFRLSIRIYRFTERFCDDVRTFRVRLFKTKDGSTISSMTLPWTWADGSHCDSDADSSFPWYAASYDLTGDLPAGVIPDDAGIEVIPPDGDVPYWTMMTVTSDITQHVTVIVPGAE
ncbi:MAG: hypothetical protein WBX15_21155 [Thermoanaerobaculia bacterium]